MECLKFQLFLMAMPWLHIQGQNYGAHRYDRIKSGVKKVVLLSLATSILISIILWILDHSSYLVLYQKQVKVLMKQ